ncbi:hydroxymethylpyrimidine/phosphomethylpyrimidine kinase [Salinisphaera sp. Q1T1-3]|uniref:bifunctional hydroxymethylpyrimidine kinase/phosphomethylpyrimidine kinase n=1 Tax=Salinisphaera sp. Q1T1-3 TaxID=2321229 RepID=UPI000E72EFC4|nr:hydroxymethylpyrimidine/phosphomethylpyrimidine kinase [Salinisphaera sp. Q1T1-3]RJS94350.1 hydroxymethylpyrimidine/phosphomethylpyrimidine kinase [Salinisphaera sp. Q1T1-3]
MSRPNVLVIAGHDPSGGAGIQADIEAIGACGAHPATVVTALTCQDTVNVHAVMPTDEAFFDDCLTRLLDDMTFAAIKTGVLADVTQVRRVAAVAEALPEIPLVVDPVLVAAGGGRLAADSVAAAMVDDLLPRATISTPNVREAQTLCDGETDIAACGARLTRHGGHVLITGGDETEDTHVHNQLYGRNGRLRAYDWPRLPGTFHGSGCTLAATLAGLLAGGRSLEDAVIEAQHRTWNMLSSAFAAGQGQAIPSRYAR